MRLVLASASPRRAELLRAAGFEFDIHAADVDETIGHAESARSYVARLAAAKAEKAARVHLDAVVIGADTAVVVGRTIFGKPRDRDDACGGLRRGRD